MAALLTTVLTTLNSAAYGLQVSVNNVSNATFDSTGRGEVREPNTCIREHLAPEFFLLGVPKSGTTRFFNDFTASPAIVNYVPGETEPEWHSAEPWVFAGGFDVSYTDTWLAHYPACDQDRRLVAIDCTPGYFGDRNAPYGLANLYSVHEVKANLVFMVLLRNPVSRMHSHYYHYVENGVLKDAIPDCPLSKFPDSFYTTARNLLERDTVCDCPCDNIVHDSRYAEAFKRYFANFKPAQFHVVPFQQVVDKAVVEYTWDILGVPHGQHQASYLTSASRIEGDMPRHPDILSELDELTLQELEAYMEQVAGASALASLFAGTEINLYNHTGSYDDGASIERWLTGSWGM